MIHEHSIASGIDILINTTPAVKATPVLPNAITKIRGDYYRGQGWLVNITSDKFFILEQHLVTRAPVKIEDIVEDEDYNPYLDAPLSPDSPRTYIVSGRRSGPVGTERVAVNNHINLWQRLGNLIILGDDGKLVNFADSPQGKILLDRISQEHDGILDFERLVPFDSTKDIVAAQDLTRYAIGSSLDKLPNLPQPLPEFSYVLWWANPDQTLPTSYKDIYGDDAEGVVFMKALSVNTQGILQVDDIVATRFRTQTYIDNSKRILDAGFQIAQQGGNVNISQFHLQGAQRDAAKNTASALINFGIV